MALGIDTQAHRGALQAGGRTAGVIGGALDRLYPRENEELAREMAAQGGAVLCEYPFGRQPDRQTFPMRNRIVSGLAKGVVVVATTGEGTSCGDGEGDDQSFGFLRIPGRLSGAGLEGGGAAAGAA